MTDVWDLCLFNVNSFLFVQNQLVQLVRISIGLEKTSSVRKKILVEITLKS